MSAFRSLVFHALSLLVVKSHNLEISEWQGVGMLSLKFSNDERVQYWGREELNTLWSNSCYSLSKNKCRLNYLLKRPIMHESKCLIAISSTASVFCISSLFNTFHRHQSNLPKWICLDSKMRKAPDDLFAQEIATPAAQLSSFFHRRPEGQLE